MTITDPWATAPAAEPEPAEEPTKAAGGITVDVTPRIRPVELDGKIVTTFKAGAGYDAPWVVIHASSVEESDALLDQKFRDYLDKVKKVAGVFSGGSSAPAQGGNAQQRSNAPQGATEAPAWAPAKPYDDFVYKTGVSKKNGKVWHAWMPPQKGDNREAVFFDPPR